MRQVIRRIEAGDRRAEIALAVYTYRIKHYIGAYIGCLGCVDALVFTAGIGENAPVVRERCCEGLQALGIEVDSQRNEERADENLEISAADSRVKILVIPTNEELRIAQETRGLLNGKPEKV
jgi:acetate kinase